MFKFFRFKNKEEFDASVNENVKKCSENLFKKCKELFREEFYDTTHTLISREVSMKYEMNEKSHQKLDSKIFDQNQKINNIEERIDFVNTKLDVVLQILRIVK